MVISEPGDDRTETMKLEGRGGEYSPPQVRATLRRSDTSGARSRADIGLLAAKRLAYVAAETGARFIRDRIQIEPIDWLHRPCQLFDGESAIIACRHAIGFERAVALHGLGLGFDSSPAIVSGIPVAAFLSDSATSYFGASPPRIREEPSRKRHGAQAIYPCILRAELERGRRHGFGPMIARRARALHFRIRKRLGPLLEDQ